MRVAHVEIGSVSVEGSTTCPNCGEILDGTLEGLSEYAWCPKCGSFDRRVLVEFGEALPMPPLDLAALGATALTLQTVVVEGAKTAQGAIIEAVAIPWFEIIAWIARDPRAMFEIGPRKWEEIIAGAYVKADWDQVILTPRSGDLGRDVIATKCGVGTVRVIDQVKAYRPDRLVTAHDVRALVGVLQLDGASKGFVTTTSGFAPRLLRDPLIKPWMPSRLELIDGPKLIARLRALTGKS